MHPARGGTVAGPKYPLVGKVVLITGAARGIGAGGATELQRRGAIVVLADKDSDALDRTASTLGHDVLALPLDVTDQEACDAAIAETKQRHGRIDVIWANAGIV